MRAAKKLSDFSVDTLHARMTEVGECWFAPAPSAVHVHVDGRKQLVRRVLLCLHRRRSLDSISGLEVWSKCGEVECLNPAHQLLGTHQDRKAWRAERGLCKHSVATKAKAAASARNRRSKQALDAEKVRLIRGSDLPATKLAKLFGCSATTVRVARRGETWREQYAGASIFTLGPR